MSRIAEVVANDLCIGCGLCESVTSGRVTMAMTPGGSLRPSSTDFTDAEAASLVAVCPGVVAESRTERTWSVDPIWGSHGTMVRAWAGDADIRHRSATGGVLTALGVHLIEEGDVAFVLHVGPDPVQPMRSRAVISESTDSLIENAGSRYGPTAPLVGFEQALDRGEPFAIVAKPCDLGAVHRFSQIDRRVDRLCAARLTMVCGGQSRLTKSRALLAEFGVDEPDVSLVRYRGYGNPGATVVETRSGDRFEKTYNDLWEAEASWDLETRCKVCPDALGEAADIAAADVWPGGSPVGDDEGFNGVVVRSTAGERLLSSAVAAGRIVLGAPITPREFDAFQPHQIRKKEAVFARLAGIADAGGSPIETVGLRIAALGERLGTQQTTRERAGTAERVRRISAEG